MTEKILVGFGLAVQLLGACIAFRGYRIGWNENASAADRFMAPVIAWSDRVHARVVSLARRIIRRRQDVRVVALAGHAAAMGMAGHARVAVVPGPVSPELDTEAAIAELDRRLRTLIERVNKAEFAIEDECTDRQSAIDRVEREVTESLSAQAEQTRQRSVRGLRIEAFGFIVLTLGALIQGVGAFFGN